MMPTPAPGFLQLPVTAVRPSPWIELALPDGTVVRLPSQNLAALIAVLRVLRGERLELVHRAATRDHFAAGALRAARWLRGRQPGLYAMEEVLGLA